ncbi:HK97-gp10 family putative phage morphogenesis protein [Deinococcus sp. PEB2-63]
MAFQLKKGREKALAAGQRRAGVVALDLRNEMVRRAPVDTGRLRQSIGVKRIGEGHYRVGTNVKYAPLVEFGTRYVPADPFMRGAVEAVKRRG